MSAVVLYTIGGPQWAAMAAMDKDRINNSPDNLKLIPSQKDHNKLHYKEDVLGHPHKDRWEEKNK